MHRQTSRRKRSRSGNTLVEFAVAFMVMIALIFIPALNMLGAYSIYVSAQALNELQSHEASLYSYEKATDPEGRIIRDLPDLWLAGGLGTYAKTDGAVKTAIDYQFADIDEFGIVNRWVQVSTTFTVKPFLAAVYLPFDVPALTSDWKITICSRRLLEDPTNAPPLTAGGIR